MAFTNRTGRDACGYEKSGDFPEVGLGSQHAGFAETVIAPALRVGGGPADNDVVQQVDIDRPGAFAELAGLCEAADYGNWATAGLTRRA